MPGRSGLDVFQDYLVRLRVMDGDQRISPCGWSCELSIDEFGLELRTDVAAYDALHQFLVSVFGMPSFRSDDTRTVIFRQDGRGVTVMMAVEGGRLQVIVLNWKDESIRERMIACQELALRGVMVESVQSLISGVEDLRDLPLDADCGTLLDEVRVSLANSMLGLNRLGDCQRPEE